MLEATKTEAINYAKDKVFTDSINSVRNYLQYKVFWARGEFVTNDEVFNEIDKVYKEKESIKSELNSKIQGNFVITPKQTHIDEETNEEIVDQETVYFELTTEQALIDSISSDYLSVSDVLNYLKSGKTFEEYCLSLSTEFSE